MKAGTISAAWLNELHEEIVRLLIAPYDRIPQMQPFGPPPSELMAAPRVAAPMPSEVMMTLESLRTADVNFDTAKEALAQAEKRLSDVLEAKKTMEQKATVLFGAYITISLALFGFGGALARDIGSKAWPVFAAGMLFVAGAAAFAHVFRGREYGNLGSQPAMWLQSGRIDGGKEAFARMIAYVTYHYDRRIRVSDDSNSSKNYSLNCGLIFGLAGALALFAAMLFIIYGFSARNP